MAAERLAGELLRGWNRRDRGNEEDQGGDSPPPFPRAPGACHSLASARLECPHNQHIDGARQTTQAGAALYYTHNSSCVKALKPKLNNKKTLVLHCFHPSVTWLFAKPVWQTSTHKHTPSGVAPTTRHQHPACVLSPVFPMVLTQEAQNKPAAAVWSSLPSVSVCQLSPAFSPLWSSETVAEDVPPLDHADFHDGAKEKIVKFPLFFLFIYATYFPSSPLLSIKSELRLWSYLCSSEEHPPTMCVFTFLPMKEEFLHLLVTSSLWDVQPYMAPRVIQSLWEAAVSLADIILHSGFSHGQLHKQCCVMQLRLGTHTYRESLSNMLQNKFWLSRLSEAHRPLLLWLRLKNK